MIPMAWWGEPGFVLLVVCGGLLAFVTAVALARQVWDGPAKRRDAELSQAAKERIMRELQRELRYRELEAENERLKGKGAAK